MMVRTIMAAFVLSLGVGGVLLVQGFCTGSRTGISSSSSSRSARFQSHALASAVNRQRSVAALCGRRCSPTYNSAHYHTTTTYLMKGYEDDDELVDSTKFAYLERVKEGLQEAGYLDEWTEAVQLLCSGSTISYTSGTSLPPLFTSNQAQDILARTWQWKSWAIVTSPMARRFVPTPDIPNATRIAESLTWLLMEGAPFDVVAKQQPDLLRTIVQKLLLECPRSYLLTPQATFNSVLTRIAPSSYRDDAAALDELIRYSPTVLCATTNCADTGCQSECGTCWVTLSNMAVSR